MCLVNWELVAGILAAIGTFLAAGAALWIATRDRRERSEERENAAMAQARLVQVKVVQVENEFDVRIHNYGDRAIIGAAVTSAYWVGHPEYTWHHSDPNHDREKVVQPERDAPSGGCVRIAFLDAKRASVPELLSRDRYNIPRFEQADPVPDAVIAFMDSGGVLWETGTAIGPHRLTKTPTSSDPFGPRPP